MQNDPPLWLRRLAAGLVLGAVDSINEAVLPLNASNAPHEAFITMQAERACLWVLSNDCDALSFLSVCAILNLSPDKLRPRVEVIDDFLRQRKPGYDGPMLARPAPLTPVALAADDDDDVDGQEDDASPDAVPVALAD